MFDIWILGIGAVISIVLVVLKLTAVITLGWLGVSIPIIIAIVIVLLKHGADFTDFLPD